jgi:hypothetical protein
MLIAREFPAGRFKNWAKCQTLLPHVKFILEREPANKELLEEWAEVLSNAMLYTWTKGSYKVTEGIVVKAVRTRERIEGRDNLRTLTSVSTLALVLWYQGKYKAVEGMNL